MTAMVQQEMTQLYLTGGELEKATDLMKESISLRTEILGNNHRALLDGCLLMARVYRLNNRIELSEKYLNKSIRNAVQSNNNVVIANVYQKVQEIRNVNQDL